MKQRVIAAAVLCVLATACPKKPPELVPPTAGSAPLDVLLALAERTRGDLSLPDARDAGYTIPTAFGPIDHALSDPLAVPSLGDALGEALDEAISPADIMRALEPVGPASASPVLYPGAVPSPPGSRRVVGLATPSEIVASPRWPVRTQHLPAPWPEAIAELVTLLETVDAGSSLWDLRGHAPTRPNRAAEEYFVNGDTGGYRFLTHPVGVQLEFLQHAASLDQGAMQADALRVLEAAQRWAPLLQEAATDLPASEGPLLQLETALGSVILGSLSEDEYDEDALLILDPGGNDRWTAGAGSNVGIPSRAALALDLGGADSYTARRSHSQGSGFLGIGVLLDAGPEGDRYLALNQTQGAGFMGVGILWDEGGNDTYNANGFGQGAGTFGVGLLVDAHGDDVVVAQDRAQGFGSTGGLGALIDWDGDDQRRLGTTGAPLMGPGGGGGQGGAFGTRPFPWTMDVSLHGGVGLLYDRSGNDSYFGRGFSQGAAWFLSMGLLLERGGRDRYTAAEWSQGTANHLAVGLLQDVDGSDIYSGTRYVQAVAADRSVGILDDRGGDSDGYRLGSIGPGTPNDARAGMSWMRQSRALAVMVDDGGDDVRRATSEALGTGVLSSKEGRDGLAVLLDLGGTDAYELTVTPAGTNPADGATWFSGEIGIAQDLDLEEDGFLPLAGWSPWSGAPDTGFTWNGSAAPSPLARTATGDSAGTAEERQTFAASLRERWLERPPESDDPDLVTLRTLASGDRSVRVRRAAGLALLAGEDVFGLDAIINSLTMRTADNDSDLPAGSLVSQLQALTGVPIDFQPAEWKRWWQQHRGDGRVASRLPAWRLLERARLVSNRGDPASALILCEQALDVSGGDPAIRRFSGTLVGSWGAILANPESGRLSDPKLAAALAQRALQWDPGGARHFVTLSRALEAMGDIDLARRAAQQGATADPDDPGVRAMQRLLGLEGAE